MPVYDYRCRSCRADHEFIVLANEPVPERCPECGGELTRRFGRVGVQLSGWGFSKTDALLPESRRRRDFKTIRDKASELFD